jgi:hypothetical protein
VGEAKTMSAKAMIEREMNLFFSPPSASEASGGEGSGVGGMCASFKHVADNRQDAVNVLKRIVIPKTQNTIPAICQKGIASVVATPLISISMMPAVQLDNNSRGVTRKIDNIFSDCCLSPKMCCSN